VRFERREQTFHKAMKSACFTRYVLYCSSELCSASVMGACRFSSSRQCALWKAGADLAAGDEVCFFSKVRTAAYDMLGYLAPADKAG
jgi:hypothetical protein